jgi:hypothetical protein
MNYSVWNLSSVLTDIGHNSNHAVKEAYAIPNSCSVAKYHKTTKHSFCKSPASGRPWSVSNKRFRQDTDLSMNRKVIRSTSVHCNIRRHG